MAKFVSGVVGAGKSAALIEYATANRGVKIAMPAMCNASHVVSRNGKRIKVDIQIDDNTEYDDSMILVDEAQFLTQSQASKLIAHGNVVFYGLTSDFKAEEFSVSAYIREHAEEMVIKAPCKFCTNDAEYNMRFEDGKPIFNGERIQLGANFIGVCKEHYK